jgi:hypothetical protein
MAQLIYTYDPGRMRDSARDRMRFELGDTQTEGGAETCALCDAEYDVVIAEYPATPKGWKKAKLALIESILARFSYEVDTKVGPMSLSLSQRIPNWLRLRDELKAELRKYSVPSANPKAVSSEHYFYEGMTDNPEVGSKER